MELAARILLTIIILGFSLIPVLADFNKTHATNPLWTGHARYHVVWQVLSYVFLAAIALYLLWAPVDPSGGIGMKLAAAIAFAIYGGFFGALFSMPLYGGRTYDDNGIQPLKARSLSFDVNISIFTAITLVLVATVFMIP
jgi:hypothetical protein